MGTFPSAAQRQSKRGLRSGSNLAIDDLQRKEGRALVTTGSARRLGARHRPQGIPKQKTPKTLINTDFFGTILSRENPILSGLTTDLTTYGKIAKIQYFFTFRGVAQLEARDVWDVDAAGSNPVTPTISLN